jgi:hypothetical protein
MDTVANAGRGHATPVLTLVRLLLCARSFAALAAAIRQGSKSCFMFARRASGSKAAAVWGGVAAQITGRWLRKTPH